MVIMRTDLDKSLAIARLAVNLAAGNEQAGKVATVHVARILAELERLRAELDERTARLERHHEHVVGARPHDCEACDPPSGLLDQATCPHADAGYLGDEWQCWDCGAYRDESEVSTRFPWYEQ